MLAKPFDIEVDGDFFADAYSVILGDLVVCDLPHGWADDVRAAAIEYEEPPHGNVP